MTQVVNGSIINSYNLNNMENNVDTAVLLPVLKKIPLFANLDENLHREIIQHIILMYYPKDYVIFNEGDQGDALYIIKKGDVKIYKNPKTEEEYVKKIADISEGGFFGEMSLISDEPRNASARTISESEIFILSKEDFKKLLDLNTSLAEQISATMVSRLNENNK